MRNFVLSSSIAITGIVAAMASGCGDGNACDYEGLCNSGAASATGSTTGIGGSGGEGGQGGSGGSTPTECIPSETSDAVGTDCGIFVSTSLGDDGNAGGRDKPVATIKRALEIAGSDPIYVCSEATPFGEDVLIEGAIEMYGGLDCANGWAYDAAKPTRIATEAGLIPVRIKSVTGSVKIEDFDLVAADATTDGGSSVGMFVTNSASVTLRRVNITAGVGKDGIDAVLVPFDFATQTPAYLKGNDASDPDLGAMPKSCTCPARDVTVGGGGGDRMSGGDAGEAGTPNFGGGAGGVPTVDACTNGGKGTKAPDSEKGLGASDVGTIDAVSGWQPAAGTPGPDGQPGQGGGGGSSDPDNLGPGASGGCGGCGGAGGPGGTGGGASIAVLVLASTLTTDGGTFTARAAGRGGNGIAGQPAQAIFGLAGTAGTGGCQGGAGGLGAAGGPGGGGAGGVSAAVVAKGGAPTITGTEMLFDETIAPGGNGGDNSIATDDGVDGTSVQILE